MNEHRETDIAELLSELSEVQTDLLNLLGEKRELLAKGDPVALQALQEREGELFARLEACQQRRQALLKQAAQDGLPADSIESLADSLPADRRQHLRPAVDAARSKARLLRHESLANWVLMQRSLLHLSQLIEIIATGGQLKPTYGSEGGTGALMDQAV